MIPTNAVATIPTGAQVSNEIDTQGAAWLGFELPAAIDSALKLSFDVAANEGGTNGVFQELLDSGGVEVALTVAAGQCISPTEATMHLLAPWRYIRVRLGTHAAPVTATAPRVITIVLKSPS